MVTHNSQCLIHVLVHALHYFYIQKIPNSQHGILHYIISIFREYQTANMEFLEVFGGWEWTCCGGVGSLDICGGYHPGYHRCHGGKLLH